MNLIIAGGRNFADYQKLRAFCINVLVNVKEPIQVLSGRCPVGAHTFTASDGIKVYGADGLGERFAKEKAYNVLPCPADWDNLGYKAGPIRNAQMAEQGTHLIAFWDGKSTGTGNMITLAKVAGLPVRICEY